MQRFADLVPAEAVNAFDDEDGPPQHPTNADGFEELAEGTDLRVGAPENRHAEIVQVSELIQGPRGAYQGEPPRPQVAGAAEEARSRAENELSAGEPRWPKTTH